METTYRTATVRQTNEENRKVQFVISDSSRDRYGTVLNMDNWRLENFNNNGIVGYQHDVYGGGMCNGPDPDTVLGKGRAWIEQNNTRDNGSSGKVLVGEVEFEPEDINPLAEKIFQKVQNGTLKATSVGFSPFGGGTLVDEDGNEYKKDSAPRNIGEDETFYFNGQELLEFSIVNIPANPNALKKNLRGQTANALQFVKRQLGHDWSYGDIEEMKVKDVIRMLERGEKPKRNKYVAVDGTELDSYEELIAHERKALKKIDKKESEEERQGDEQPDHGLRKLNIRKRELEQKMALTNI